MQVKKLTIDGVPVVYYVTGHGKPVLLVHGFGEDHLVWQRQIDFLKEKFLLIIPDLPGSGPSPSIKNMSMEGLAEVLHVIIKKELSKNNFQLISIIGHSMGGYITLAFVEKYATLINSFGLFHSSAFADSEEKKETRRKGIEFIKKNGEASFLKTTIPNLFSTVTHQQQPNLIAQQINDSGNYSADSLVKYYEAMIERPDRTHVLKNSGVPVLFIMGEFDKAVPLSDSLNQSYLPERSYIKLLKKSAHMGMYEQTNESNQILENFLQNDT